MTAIDDPDLFLIWLNTLTRPNPDVSRLASLEDMAADRGWSMTAALQALTAGPFSRLRKAITPDFDPDLHPRGNDGKFISTGGGVRLSGKGPNGVKLDGLRGVVQGIDPDPRSPGKPNIRVGLFDPRKPGGPPARVISVKPDQISEDLSKARLDAPNLPDAPAAPGATPAAPAKSLDELRAMSPEDLDAHIAQMKAEGIPFTDQRSKDAVMVRNNAQNAKAPAPVRSPDDAKAALTALADSPDVKKALDLQRTQSRFGQGPVRAMEQAIDGLKTADADNLGQRADDFTKALEGLRTDLRRESDAPGSTIGIKQNGIEMTPDRQTIGKLDQAITQSRNLSQNAKLARAPGTPNAPNVSGPRENAQRLSVDAQRAALIADINANAKNLSTDDADLRAEQMEDFMGRMRFSVIDTDKVYDHLIPPDDESGKWVAERHAMHEAMWDDLISKVEAAGIPKDHDALVLGGLPGAGKSYSLKPGQKADGFGVVSWEPNVDVPAGATHVSINPDIVKEMLIQRGALPKGISGDLKPMEQVTFIHEESSMVAKMFSARLAKEGYNIVLDNTMDSKPAMLKRMTPLAEKGYKFRALFVDIPVDESLISATKRYKDAALTPEGGRFVPSSVQGNRKSPKGSLSLNRDAMDGLVADDWFTNYMIINNSGISERKPLGEITGQGTGTGSAATAYAKAAAEKLAGAAPAAPATAPATLAPV